MPSSRPIERLGDILENIGRIQSYTSDLERDGFLSNPLVQDGVERCLMRISEAATKLGILAEQEMPNQRWQEIRGLGNALRHEYDFVDPVVIWSVVQKDLPNLQAEVAAAIVRLRDRAS